MRRSGEWPQCHHHVVRLEIALRLGECPVALAAVLLSDVDHGERQAERRRLLGRGVQRRAGALGAVVREERARDLLPAERGDEHRLRALTGDGLRRAPEQPGGELLVDPAATDDHEIGDPRLVTDLVGHDAHRQRRFVGHAGPLAPRAEGVEQDVAAFLERLAHLGGEVEVGLEAERAGDVVQERALDRHDVEDVEAGQAGPQPARQPETVLERAVGMLRAVERDQDALHHGASPPWARL
jgi:hypothetical protein